MRFSDYKQTAKEYNIGGGFWRPEKGANKVRILSGYDVYGYHWDNAIKQGGICIGKDNNCKWCAAGNKPKAKFLMWILDRKDEMVKIAQLGYTVIQQIGELQAGEDWGFETTPDYDVVIKRSGEDLETKYFLQPTPKRIELTAEEQEKADKTMKDLKEIISRMKEKAGGSSEVIQIDEEDIPEGVDGELNPTAPDPSDIGEPPMPMPF